MGNKLTSTAVGRHTADVDSDLDFFLIGKTGHGKSAAGNTILGRKQFRTSDMLKSSTLNTDAGWFEKNGMIIKVVDGPGLLDTRLAGASQTERMMENVWKGFRNCPNGFHALLLVLSYGTRFTEEEEATVSLLKRMFGENVIRDHCILVFTHGDSFALNNENKKFRDWCKEQNGFLGELLKESNNRAVLFHNLTPEKRDKSLNRLISHARGIDRRITVELFTKIRVQRHHFIEKNGAVQLKERIQSKIDLIIDCLQRGESGKQLKGLLGKLENEIGKESSELPVVHDIKQGIQLAWNGKYDEALESFRKLELDAEMPLFNLNEITLDVVGQSLRSLFPPK